MNDVQGKLPAVLSVVFMCSIAAAARTRLRTLQGTSLYSPTLIIVGLYLVWLALELRVAAKEIGRGHTYIDSHSLEIYAISRAAVVLTGLFVLPQGREHVALLIAGSIVFVASLALRLAAIERLGRLYSHRVRVQDRQRIVTEGPYRLIRHPAYSGMIFSHLGFVLFFFNPWTLAIWAFFHVPAVIYRILVEEKALSKIPGYVEYAAATKRIVPFLW